MCESCVLSYLPPSLKITLLLVLQPSNQTLIWLLVGSCFQLTCEALRGSTRLEFLLYIPNDTDQAASSSNSASESLRQYGIRVQHEQMVDPSSLDFTKVDLYITGGIANNGTNATCRVIRKGEACDSEPITILSFHGMIKQFIVKYSHLHGFSRNTFSPICY